jgi:hypothetical protein
MELAFHITLRRQMMNPFKAVFSRLSRHNRQTKPRRTRLGLESLDDRCLPSATLMSGGLNSPIETPQIVGAHIGTNVVTPEIVGEHVGS